MNSTDYGTLRYGNTTDHVRTDNTDLCLIKIYNICLKHFSEQCTFNEKSTTFSDPLKCDICIAIISAITEYQGQWDKPLQNSRISTV